jgi:hypothetical protein
MCGIPPGSLHRAAGMQAKTQTTRISAPWVSQECACVCVLLSLVCLTQTYGSGVCPNEVVMPVQRRGGTPTGHCQCWTRPSQKPRLTEIRALTHIAHPSQPSNRKLDMTVTRLASITPSNLSSSWLTRRSLLEATGLVTSSISARYCCSAKLCAPIRTST